MSDEAKVILSAVDNVTIPALQASDSLRAYQGSVDALASLTGGAASGINPAYTKSLGGVSDAAEHAGQSHRVAHQAMGLFSQGLGELAGASPAAEAGIRVLDSAMLHMATTGSMMSFGFIGLVAAATAAGYAFRSSAEHAKTEKEAVDHLSDSIIANIKARALLTPQQKEFVGVALAKATQDVEKYTGKIRDLEEEMKKSNAQALLMSKPQRIDLGGMEGSVEVSAKSDGGAEAKKRFEDINNLRTYKTLLEEAQREKEKLEGKVTAYKTPKLFDDVIKFQYDLKASGEAASRSADHIEEIGRALGDTKTPIVEMKDGLGHVKLIFPELEEMAHSMGISVGQAAQFVNEKTTAAFTGMAQVAANSMSSIGAAAAQAAFGVANAWHNAVNAIIQDVIRMAIQWVEKYIIMAQVAALAHEVTTKGIFGLITGLAAIGAISAIGAGLQQALAAHPADAGSSAYAGSPSTSFSPTQQSPSGPGGTAISSSARDITNHITVSMPVQALDLTAVSDFQMKALATKIGRIISDSAGQGQFSLVGA